MLPNIQIGIFARFFASHHHDVGRMCGCCQMLRLDRKLQWRHPAPAKWDEVRNYIHKTKLHEDAKMTFCNQGSILYYLECRHFKSQIVSTKPCAAQEINWKYPILFDHAKRVFLVLPTTFNLAKRITVTVFFLQLEVILINILLQNFSYLLHIESKWSLDRTQNGSPSAFAFQSSAPQRARICLLNPITAPGQMFSQRKMFNANTHETTTNIQIWSRATTLLKTNI